MPDTVPPVIGCTVQGLNGMSFPAGTELSSGIFFANDEADGAITPVITVTRDGQPFPFSGSAFLNEAGTYAITVEAADKAGNKATETYTVTVFVPDTVPPVLVCALGDLNGMTFPVGQVLDGAIFTAADNVDNAVTPVVTLTRNGEPYEFNGYAELPEGVFVITVNATDKAGNKADPLVYQVTVGDPATTPPVLACTYEGLYDGAVFAAGQYFNTVIFTATDDVDGAITPTVMVSVDGGEPFPFAGETNLQPGTYHLAVTAADKAGNEATPLEYHFTVNP